MKTVISSKGQIVLPAELRKKDRIRPGQRFKVERVKAGKYVLTKEAEPANQGLVDLLLACPVKGWFKPVESIKRESTAEWSRKIEQMFSE